MVAVPDVGVTLFLMRMEKIRRDTIAAVVAVGEEDGGWRDDVGDGVGGRRGAVAGRRTL